jgi:hypothetical protein
MHTVIDALRETVALERQTMALYARFSECFASDRKMSEFWFEMARDEARHVGALELVETMLQLRGVSDRVDPSVFDQSAVTRSRKLLEKAANESKAALSIQRALEIALEIEESELEDVVGSLLRSVKQGGEYARFQRLLVHDLGNLSYMIERYCDNPELLQRCDALVNRHAEALSGLVQQ